MTYQGYIGTKHAIGGRGAVKLQIDNKTYVVKCWPLEESSLPASGSKTTAQPLKVVDPSMADHLMNTNLINGLGLEDVHAPASQELTDGFKQALKTQLITQALDPNVRRELVQALNGNAMISPMAPGLTIDKLFFGTDVSLQDRKTLLDYVMTKDGAYALGELITIDLIDGMHDRLVEHFNGGNFSFDPQTKQLWCIDNAKNHNYAMSFTDDSAWKQWVITSTYERDDKTVAKSLSTDKGKSLPELFHWMIYERQLSNSGFVQEIKLSDQAKNETLAGIKQSFTDTCSELLRRLGMNLPGFLTPSARQRLGQRLAFLDARNKFTDLLSFTEFETIPTSKDKKPNPNDPLFTKRSAFVNALNAHTNGLVNLKNSNAEKAWGQLDPAVTERIKTIAANWAKALKTAGDSSGAQAVLDATDAFIKQLNIVAA